MFPIVVHQIAVAIVQGAACWLGKALLPIGRFFPKGTSLYSNMVCLQVKNQQGQWISADPIPGTFVCNIGDMLKVSPAGFASFGV